MADLAGLSRQPVRYQSHESPLATLSRRKGRDGQPFLTRKQTTAGERLREDYELARPVDGTDGGWQAMMRGEVPDASEGAAQGVIDARARLRSALAELGPGLGDVALRCCCMLEGLEQTEKAMGWSARSGKIVLRIALERLARHYEQTQGAMGPMIG